MARHVWQEHLVHGTEQPLDLAPPAGATGPGMNELDLQRDAGLLDLLRDEIATVVDVEHLGNAADWPSRIGLAPDRLVQRQRGVHGRRRVGRHHVAHHGTAVIVHHHRQPGPNLFAMRVQNEDVEHRMVGLPHFVGRDGVTSVHQLVPVTVGGRVGGDSDACSPNPARHVRNDRIAWLRRAMRVRLGRYLAMDGGDSWAGASGRQRADHGLQAGIELATGTGIAATRPFQTCNAAQPVGSEPAAQRALRHAGLGGKAGQGDVVLQMGLDRAEARGGRRRGEAGGCHGPDL